MPSAVHDLEVISSGRSFSIFRSQGVNLGGSASTLCSEGGGGEVVGGKEDHMLAKVQSILARIIHA